MRDHLPLRLADLWLAPALLTVLALTAPRAGAQLIGCGFLDGKLYDVSTTTGTSFIGRIVRRPAESMS